MWWITRQGRLAPTPGEKEGWLARNGMTATEEDHPGSGTQEQQLGPRTYDRRRNKEVEAEIASLPVGVGSDLVEAAVRATHPETVVHALRRLYRQGKPAQPLEDALVKLAIPILANSAKRQFPESHADREDAAQIAASHMVKEVRDTRPAEDFWEWNFYSMVRRACSDAADTIRSQHEHERPFRRTEDAEGRLQAEEDALEDDKALDPNEDLLLSDALDPLEGDVRRAVYLDSLGVKTFSKKQGEISIASLLGKSRRTVDLYLARGKAVLRAKHGGSGRSPAS